jgi:hypothetical protein
LENLEKRRPSNRPNTKATEKEKPASKTNSMNKTGGSKSIKSYLFDFFMLFLAVFCGYLAQWQLENSGEHQREKQFIQSLVEDIKKDTSVLNTYINFNQKRFSYCDSLQRYIRVINNLKESNRFYDYSRELARYLRYFSTDRTIQQLKNAGNMRLIKNMDVSNAITDYDNKTKYLNEFDQRLIDEISKYRDLLIETLDLENYDTYNPQGSFMANNTITKGNPGFIRMNSQYVKTYYNQAFTLKTFLTEVLFSAENLKKEAILLLDLLQEEYKLDTR